METNYDIIISKIAGAKQRWWRSGETIPLIVFVSRDVFAKLQNYSSKFINYQYQTICGCKVKIIDGENQLYVGLDLLEEHNYDGS